MTRRNSDFYQVDRLCGLDDAFGHSPANDRLFVQAMKENVGFQMENQPYLAFLAERQGFSIDRVETLPELLRMPSLFVDTMKRHCFSNIPRKAAALVLTSSGTSGQKTQLILDQKSLDRLNRLAFATMHGIGFSDDRPAHYLAFSYDRSQAAEVGTSWSDEQCMQFAPAKSAHWLIKQDAKGAFVFDYQLAARLFIDLAADAPIRMLGFPAFMYQMIEEIRKITGRVQAAEGSFIIAGGGWKNHQGRPMQHASFATYVEKHTGIPRENVRDTYGMTEHGVPYASCSHGHHHVPVFSRLQVVDPLTMAAQDYGQPGLLRLFTPYNTAQPNQCVLSTDVVVLQKDCPCGLPGDYIAGIRRGGRRKHKGCAIAALDILRASEARQKGD